MKNLKRDGLTFEFVVSGTARTSGSLDNVGKIVGIHAKDAAIGDTAVLEIKGVYKNVPKLSTDVVAAGDPLYFDVANGGGGTSTARVTKTVAANVFAGWADVAAGNGVTTVDLILLGGAPLTTSA